MPGAVSVQITEQNAHGCYRRWADYMAERSWSELLGGDDASGAVAAMSTSRVGIVTGGTFGIDRGINHTNTATCWAAAEGREFSPG